MVVEDPTFVDQQRALFEAARWLQRDRSGGGHVGGGDCGKGTTATIMSVPRSCRPTVTVKRGRPGRSSTSPPSTNVGDQAADFGEEE